MMEKTKNNKKYFSAALLAFSIILLSGILFSQGSFLTPGEKPAITMSILISALVVALGYALVHTLHLETLKGLMREEMGHLAITALLVGLLVFALSEVELAAGNATCVVSGINGMCGGSSTSGTYMSCNGAPGGGTCQHVSGVSLSGWALNAINAENGTLNAFLANAVSYNNKVSETAATSGYCMMLGTGFSVAGCSAWGALRGPVGQMVNAAGMGAMELGAMRILIALNGFSAFGTFSGISYTMSLLMPLGIILRSLYFTRKAGDTLISLALSLYFVMPAAFIVGNAMADNFIKNPNYSAYGLPITLDTGRVSNCDPYDPSETDLINAFHAIENSPDPANFITYPSLADRLLFFVIVRITLVAVFALTATMAATRAIGMAFGADIEVMNIARLS
jgi:hypothetical protein